MRLRLILAVLALTLVPVAVAAVGWKVTLKAPAADPKINVKWFYSITARDLEGHPLKALLTAQVIDPFGGVHPMDYGPSMSQTPITNRPFKGTFRDYIISPPSSRGFDLKLRWTVKTKVGAKWQTKVLTRKVTPK